MNVYEVTHDGIYLGGRSIVVAPNVDRALALTKFALVELKLDVDNIRIARAFDLNQELCVVVDNGDY